MASHAHNCISRHCQGCGPESEIGKIEKKLQAERQRNAKLLENIVKVRAELEVAKSRIRKFEEGAICS